MAKFNTPQRHRLTPKMYEYLGDYSYTLDGRLCKLGRIIQWECSRIKSRIEVLFQRHKNPRKEPRSDSRIITDIKYMHQYGLTLKEARRSPYTRRNPSTMWHDWKQEEYTYNATSNRSDPDSLLPDLDRGDTKETTVSPLTQLPPELLDLIISFLPADAELTLRLSCLTLYHHHGSQTVFSLIYNLRIHPNLAVRHRTRWISNSWLLPRFPSHRMMPGGCLLCFPCEIQQHPRFWFATEEEEAWERSGGRTCLRGTRGLYYVSPRHSVALRQLVIAAQEG